LGSIARRGRQPELPTFLTAAPSESYQQSFYAKRCTAPRCAAILLRLDTLEFPASRMPPRDRLPARPLVPMATISVVERDKNGRSKPYALLIVQCRSAPPMDWSRQRAEGVMKAYTCINGFLSR